MVTHPKLTTTTRLNYRRRFTSVDSRFFDLLADSLKVFVQFVFDDRSNRVLQRTRTVADVTV